MDFPTEASSMVERHKSKHIELASHLVSRCVA
jgi:hypothetical protein